MLITCSAFCLEMWDVIWKMRFKFVLCRNYLKWFILVIMLDHLIVNFFDSSRLIFDEWRMLIFDYRVTYVYSRFVERRLWWDVKLDEASHQIWKKWLIKFWRKRLIKLDEWKRHLIKSDENDSSNLMTLFHQIERARHLIKFLKKKTIFLFSDEQSSATTFDVKNLILQKIIFCVKIAVISERS